jgi:hypothetical protein
MATYAKSFTWFERIESDASELNWEGEQ